MRCLICLKDGIPTTAQTCPYCGVLLSTLFSDTLPAGTLLHNGSYRIDYVLGRGGFGIIYRAIHIALEHPVAIKEFYPEGNARRSGRAGSMSVSALHGTKFNAELHQFLHEGRILAGLSHPGIVSVRDLFEERGTAYLVMEIIPGCRLREELDKQHGKGLPAKQVRKIIGQLVPALEFLHQSGVYHLDIKPENVILTPTGRPVLVDFGAARTDVSRPTTQQFDELYMAPELTGGKVGPQSDLFELGMLTHELLTGKRPPSAAERAVGAPLSMAGLDRQWQKPLTQALHFSKEARPGSVETWWSTSFSEEKVTRKPIRVPGLSRRQFLIGALSLAIAVGGTALLTETLPDPLGSTLSIYKGHSSAVFAVAWSPDGQHLASASADKTVRVWNPFSRDLYVTYKGHSSAVFAVAWSPDGQRLASASADKTVRVWNPFSGKLLLEYKGHTDTVYTIAWSPDGQHIASGSKDKTVRVWNATSGKSSLTYKGHTSWVYTLAWSPESKNIASGAADGMVEIWNAISGKRLLAYRGHPKFVDAVAWSPDSHEIITGGSDTIIKVWNATSGHQILVCKGHLDCVYSVAWSPDGQYMASGSRDKTVKIWDADSGHVLFTYRAHTGWIRDVTWSPNSKSIASASADKTVRVWKAAY